MCKQSLYGHSMGNLFMFDQEDRSRRGGPAWIQQPPPNKRDREESPPLGQHEEGALEVNGLFHRCGAGGGGGVLSVCQSGSGVTEGMVYMYRQSDRWSRSAIYDVCKSIFEVGALEISWGVGAGGVRADVRYRINCREGWVECR